MYKFGRDLFKLWNQRILQMCLTKNNKILKRKEKDFRMDSFISHVSPLQEIRKKHFFAQKKLSIYLHMCTSGYMVHRRQQTKELNI